MKRKSDRLRPARKCLGCGLKFRASRSDNLFCDYRCYRRSRSCVPENPKLGAREIPLTLVTIEVREIVLKGASYHAEYYTVTSVDLQVEFPLPHDTVRSTGLRPTMPMYKLEPFEFPMVPIEGSYIVHYFTALGSAVPPQDPRHNPELLISFTYPLSRSATKELRAGLRQFLTDRKPRLAAPSPKKKRLGLPPRTLAAVGNDHGEPDGE